MGEEAEALYSIAKALRKLGVADAMTPMGAIEAHALMVEKLATAVESGLTELATAVSDHGAPTEPWTLPPGHAERVRHVLFSDRRWYPVWPGTFQEFQGDWFEFVSGDEEPTMRVVASKATIRAFQLEVDLAEQEALHGR